MTRSYILIVCALLVGGGATFAQKAERGYVRSGNKLYKDSLFTKAEVDYRKALDVNPKSTEAAFNLGNALLMQQKGQEAIEQYTAAANVEKDKSKLAQIYHNIGVVLQSAKQYPACIEAYKKSLRNNPNDDETRYNLALAQKLLKDQQQNQQQNQDNKKNEQDKKEDKNQQEQKQNQDNKDKKEQNQNKQQQQQKKEDEMSKDNAQQLLNAVMQDEKDVQEKVKKQLQVKGKKFDKDW